MLSQAVRPQEDVLWTLTHMSFAANKTGMISPAHGPAVKGRSYITFVCCVTNTNDFTGQNTAITISKTELNFNPCPPESSLKNLQQLNGSLRLMWLFFAFTALRFTISSKSQGDIINVEHEPAHHNYHHLCFYRDLKFSKKKMCVMTRY